MTLDEEDIKWGLEFIAGTWNVDYLVDFQSNDLEHIPAQEYKSADGKNYSALSFEFLEDSRLLISDSSSGKKTESSWKQTGINEYRCPLNGFLDISQKSEAKASEIFSVMDGVLTFTLEKVTVVLKKVSKGKITDIGKLDSDPLMTDIAGFYEVAATLYYPIDSENYHSKEEGLALLEKQKSLGKIDEESYESCKTFFTMNFDKKIEFASDGKVNQWFKISGSAFEDASEADLKAAAENGEIGFKDGTVCLYDESRKWKAVNGFYYFYTGDEDSENPWYKIRFTDDGFMKLTWGSCDWYLKKIS